MMQYFWYIQNFWNRLCFIFCETQNDEHFKSKNVCFKAKNVHFKAKNVHFKAKNVHFKAKNVHFKTKKHVYSF